MWITTKNCWSRTGFVIASFSAIFRDKPAYVPFCLHISKPWMAWCLLLMVQILRDLKISWYSQSCVWSLFGSLHKGLETFYIPELVNRKKSDIPVQVILNKTDLECEVKRKSVQNLIRKTFPESQVVLAGKGMKSQGGNAAFRNVVRALMNEQRITNELCHLFLKWGFFKPRWFLDCCLSFSVWLCLAKHRSLWSLMQCTYCTPSSQ